MRQTGQFADLGRAVRHRDPFIGGSFLRGEGEILPVENPATEQVIAEVRQCSPGQLDQAVRAARAAFRSGVWKDPDRRSEVLLVLADALEEREAELRSLLVQEVGTPVSLCEPLQIGGPVAMIRDLAMRTKLDRTRALGPDGKVPSSESIVKYEPVGVVAGIGAYNYPLTFVVSKAVAAMAAGCAAVYVPSPQTPLATLLFADIASRAGVPAGILNILVGGADIAAALSLHPGVDKVSFTGSVEVGRKVMAQAAQGIRDVVLELGGKSAGLVLPGADIGEIAMLLHARYIRNCGQGCQSPTRIFVPEDRFEDFIDVSRDVYARVRVGDPWDPETIAGPLISKAHRARVEGFVGRALAAGGRLLLGGGRPGIGRGWYINPALIGNVGNDSELARNELFAPVAMVTPYKTLDEAIGLANASGYGLAAHVYGPQETAMDVADRLEAGSIFINGGGLTRVESVLCGWKQSGIGSEWGEDGLREFLVPKHIQWKLSSIVH